MGAEGAIENGALLDAFRHNSWATRELVAFCRRLPDEQLTSPITGSYGGILATFNHLVSADAGYLRSLAGTAPAWVDEAEDADLDQLDARAAEMEQLWERLLSKPLDAERVLLLDKGTYEAHAGVVIAQALHHGNTHREQICTILTGFDIEPPDLQPWAYGDATGRGGELHPSAN